MKAARFFLLGCVLATTACAAEAEDIDSGEGAVTGRPVGLAPGIERRQGGDLARSVHFGNAYVLAVLSKASYGAKTTPESLAAMGLPGITSVVSYDNRCTGGDAIYVESPSIAVLAFRGTEMNSDLDIAIEPDDAFTAYPLEGARVHSGFLRQFRSLWDASPDCGVASGIGTLLATRPQNKPLYFTGHSLGGALATLALAQTFVEGNLPPVAGVYSFGAPKVGDRTFAEIVGDRIVETKTPYYRFVHKNDIVPTQPRPLGWTETWQHVKPSGAMEHAFQVWFDAKSSAPGTMAMFLGFSIPDHLLDGYVSDLAANARTRGEL